MTPQAPPIDERSFDDLMAEAEARLRASCPDWTDFGPGDPGRTLVEVFAHLTEILIWRANRLPDRARIEFLRMAGMTLRPPAAAQATLVFRRQDTASALTVPAGSGVMADAEGRALRFETVEPAVFAPGEAEARARAAHAEVVEAERLGASDGGPGQSFRVAHAPIVAPTGAPRDLAVGVATEGRDRPPGTEAIDWQGARFALWQEVRAFDHAGADRPVFVADRASGVIRFAPATRVHEPDGSLSRAARPLGAVPPQGREIRAWYRTGGGEVGNVPAHALTRLEAAIEGVGVDNPEAATGGRDAEPLEQALVRAPHAIAASDRAVTARDYEALAAACSDVGRALADAPAERWAHAAPGTVEVLLTPWLTAEERRRPPTRARLEAAQTGRALEAARAHLAERRPLGARLEVRWARYKPVRVRVRAALHPFEDAAATTARLRERLDRLVSPLPDPDAPGTRGWPFGAPLRSWHVNDIARHEAAIAYLDDPVIETPETPTGVCADLAADGRQPGVWYAACGDAVFRSVDDGEGWELARRFEGECPTLVAAPAAWHGEAAMAGLVAVVTRPEPGGGEGPGGGALWASRDCGETWALVLRFEAGLEVSDLDFLMREAGPTVLMAAGDGLREITLGQDRNWRRVLIDAAAPDLRAWAVTVARNPPGSAARHSVMASGDGRGLFFSAEDGRAGTFRPIGPRGLEDKLFRVLRTHEFAGRARIWAGVRVPGSERGPGCFEYRVTGADEAPRVAPYGEGWNGESCRGLAFMGERVMAATHDGGVMTLSLSDAEPVWRPSEVGCGLPQRSLEGLQPIEAIAAGDALAMAAPGRLGEGEGGGVYRSRDGQTFSRSSRRLHRGRVTLPPGWLFCAAEEGHVVDEIDRDADAEAEGEP